MQQNSTENSSKCLRSPENIREIQTKNSVQLPRVVTNPRFAITAESMNMNLQNRQQIPQHQGLVDVKCYHERYSNKSLIHILPDCKPEPNEPFQNPDSNTTTTNSYASIGTENTVNQYAANIKTEYSHATQSPSPTVSPNVDFQQWNFEHHLSKETTPTNTKFSADSEFVKTLKSPGDHYNEAVDLFMNNSPKLNFKVFNEIFAKRIESIDADAWGDKDLKICTYQEWIKFLTKISESFLNNIEELEREVEGHFNVLQKRTNSNCRYSQASDIVCTEVNEGDEVKKSPDPDNVQRNQLCANIKALAHEVAEKHDEVRELKRQVICLEDEIQKAQKKIQLKDDVIKELRNDLKCVNHKLSAYQSLDSSLTTMSPINFETQTCRSYNTQQSGTTPSLQNDDGSQFDSLSHTEMLENENLNTLKQEILEFFEMNRDFNKQQIESQRKRLMEMIENLESEKLTAYRKFICSQLNNLECSSVGSNYDGDSGFHSKSENNEDVKLLEGVRKRLCKLKDSNTELNKRIHKLELEKHGLSTQLESEKSLSNCNNKTLKDIAALLCELTGKNVSYTEIYENKSNPFREAIIEMQRDFEERESQLQNALYNKEESEMSQFLLGKEKDVEQEKIMKLNLNIIKDKDVDNNATIITKTTQPVTNCTSTCILTPEPSTTVFTATLTGRQLGSTIATSTSLQEFVKKI